MNKQHGLKTVFPSSAAHAAAVRSPRERTILALLRRSGSLTRSELIKSSGLSGTAVFRATEELADQGLILIGDPVPSGRGQPSHEILLNQDAAFSLGMSVMTDIIEFLLLDLGGNVRFEQTIANDNLGLDQVLEALDAFLHTAARKHRIARTSIHSLGIAIAGFFVGDGDKVNPPSELDHWALKDVSRYFADATGLPVMVENTGSAAALGEQLLGQGQNHADFAYCNIASGLGGGIIKDGRLLRGAHGNAGEFAAVLRVAGQPKPSLEHLRETLAAHGTVTDNVRDCLDRFDPEWPGIDQWIEQTSQTFVILTQLIHYTVDVDAVVLGGRLPRELAVRLSEAAQKRLSELRYEARRDAPLPLPRIVPAEVSANASAIGAASLSLARDFFEPINHLVQTG